MPQVSTYQISISEEFNALSLKKGLHIVVQHATRTPPHIGLIVGGKYHSLTIKGQELNVSSDALLRNIIQRKIPSLFISVKEHLTFSEDYLKEHFISNVQEFAKVAVGEATCLSPIKKFFEENYHIDIRQIHYLFELLPVLEEQGLIKFCSSLFIDQTSFELPVYSMKELNDSIHKAHVEASTIKNKK